MPERNPYRRLLNQNHMAKRKERSGIECLPGLLRMSPCNYYDLGVRVPFAGGCRLRNRRALCPSYTPCVYFHNRWVDLLS